MSEPRVIKKYPNRRLYDTVESRYITLADVRRLVVERIEFVVVDKKNNADITRSILLQVIAEQEHLAEPILSQDFMVNVIRAYGTTVQGLVSSHLEQNLKQIMSQQQQARPPRMRAAADESFKALSPMRTRDGDKDRDDTMRGADIFDAAHFPTAHYVTRSVTRTATGFSAVGALTLHGVTKDVPIEFQFAQQAAGAKLSGSAKLKRLDFGVGQGDWKSTDTIGDAVKINFSLVLKPKG